MSIYDTSKPEFSFPEGFSVKDSYVYQIRVATTDESLVMGIQVTLKNLIPQSHCSGGVTVIEAAGNPIKWGANMPVFGFSQVGASRLVHSRGAVKVIGLRSRTCYLVLAGK